MRLDTIEERLENWEPADGPDLFLDSIGPLLRFAKAARAVIDGDYTMWDDPADAMAGDLSRALNELENPS